MLRTTCLRSILAALAATMLLLVSSTSGFAANTDGNRLTYLDAFSTPYYATIDSPKLITPQWVGEEDVELVVTLGIDDMRESKPYEEYLRPILDRLKEIDGRAPVSIMTNEIDPADPQLQVWLAEGVSLETHTIDHPCPCLNDGDFAKARSTYDRCIDLLAEVPNSHPVAFRFPCMDSLNTPSPRAFAEIVNRVTPEGNFAQISTSVICALNEDDPALPKELVLDDDGRPRLEKYLPFRSFVNKVENYPYPFVIDKLCWEFPCSVPDDWQGQYLHSSRNPQTVADYKAATDATAIKQGVANLVFHPYDWIRSDQMIDIIDHAVETHGPRVRFLNFRECLERLNANLLAGQPLRAANGQDNGVRLLDVNGDGFLDVLIGNEHKQLTRVWQPASSTWREYAFPVQLVEVADDGTRSDGGVRFGVMQKGGAASFFVANESARGVWHFTDKGWVHDEAMLDGLKLDGESLQTIKSGLDQGVRLRDFDGDGICELLIANPTNRAIFRYLPAKRKWQRTEMALPEPLVNRAGGDAGARFVDLDQDGHDDLVFSDEHRYSVHRFESTTKGFSHQVRAGVRSDENAIPMIVRAGTNNGAWFANRHMWVQNEDSSRLSDGVDRRSFGELLGSYEPGPLSPEEALAAMVPRRGLRIEQVAAEPLVMDPIAFDWGADGKLWVVEMADYPLGLDDHGQPGGRVRFLEDTDGDGKYDRSTLYLDGLSYPTGVMAWRDGILVSAAPDLIFARGINAQGRPEQTEVLFTGFGQGNQQHRFSGFAWGLDNWVHLANGDSSGTIVSRKTGSQLNISGRDLRINPDTGDLNTQTGMSQFGRFRDDWGNWFGCVNPVPLRHFVLRDHYLRRNPHFAPPRVSRDVATVDNTRLFPISKVLSHFQGYQSPSGDAHHRFTSASGTCFYRDDLFGPLFENNMFTCAPVHNLVHRRVVSPAGINVTTRRAAGEMFREFLASTDSWFRPTLARTGPDGALWVSDMYRLVIEHPEWISDNQEQKLDLRAGHERGRIYRIYPEDARLRPIPALADYSTRELVAALDSPSGWQRDTVQRLLIHRGDKIAIRPLRKTLRSSERPLARLHALCTLGGMKVLSDEDLRHALQDTSAGVRRHGIRLAQPRLQRSEALQNAVVGLLYDNNPMVQLQLAYAGWNWDGPLAAAMLGQLADWHGDDMDYAIAIMGSVRPDAIAPVMASTLRPQSVPQNKRWLNGKLIKMAVKMQDQQAIQIAVDAISPPRDNPSSDIVSGDTGPPTQWQIDALSEFLRSTKGFRLRVDGLVDSQRQENLQRTITAANALLDDHEADPELRKAVVRLLSHLPEDHNVAPRTRMIALLNANQPPVIQWAAINSLKNRAEASIADDVLVRWDSFTPKFQRGVIHTLLSRPDWTKTLLRGLAEDPTVARNITAAYRQQLLNHRDASIRQQAKEIFSAKQVSDRAALVEFYRSAKTPTGDAALGEALFKKQCASCHRQGEEGHAVGPDLRMLKDRSYVGLLTSVLDPNRAVEDKFRGYVVLTTDGLVLTGLLTAESATSITLLAAQGVEQTIARSDIDTLKNTGKSMMPEGLEQDLPPEALRHLHAYLFGSEMPNE